MNIFVCKSLSDDMKFFDSIQDFNKFYTKHKKHVNETNTKALNVKYKITGYKSGRKNGVLKFIQTEKNDEVNEKFEEIKIIEEYLMEIKHMLKHIIKNMVIKPQ